MSRTGVVERGEDDFNLRMLQNELDICAEEMGSAGCEGCSCQRLCDRLWASIKPARDNMLSVDEYFDYSRKFKALRAARYCRQYLPLIIA